MRINLFWKLGLAFAALLLAVLVALDFYTARIVRQQALAAANDQLTALSQLAVARWPAAAEQLSAAGANDPVERASLDDWVAWVKQSGTRATVIAADGTVLADSDSDFRTMENHSNRPEVQQALATGQGSSVRHSATLGRDLVYRAVRFQTAAGGQPIVLRFAVPLAPIEATQAQVQRRLAAATLVILALGAIVGLIFVRTFSARVERLKEFSKRVARGDFRAMPADSSTDALADLGVTLNRTARQLERTMTTLEQERNRSAAILASMAEGVAVIDAQERMVFCNQAFRRIFALGTAPSEGRPMVELVREPELLTTVRKALAGKVPEAGELERGTVHRQSFRVTASPLQSGETAGAALVLHDITDLRRLERVRRDFVANVSHEFKTPLTAIQGFAETLLGGALEDKTNNRRFLEIIRTHAARLARLTDDLLELARIEAGRIELDCRDVSLEEIIEACADTTRPRIEHGQLQLDLRIPDDLPDVYADPRRLREILQNLLDNAAQYTPSGGQIWIEARLDRTGENAPAAGISETARGDDSPGSGDSAPRDTSNGAPRGGTVVSVIVTVGDTGIGIPHTDQERIFERFYRVDAARSREAGGTGLGLAITKHLVELHGGRMWVESEVGSGSEFHFSVPIARHGTTI
ncbi:MAG: ATP-binding protein [Candidatus Acidiferrales bacterium]